MTIQLLRKAICYGTTATILALLLGLGSMTSSAAEKKPAPKPAPKAAAKAPARPAGGGASHGPTAGGASHGPTTGGATTHGPTTGGATTHGPTTGGAATGGTHTTGATTGGGAGGGAHTTPGGAAGSRPGVAGGGAHPGGVGGAGAHSGGAAGGHPSAIHGGAAPRGSNEHVTKSGSAVRTRPGGRVSDVHDARRGMDVHHGLNGNRRVSVERHDGSRMVSERGRRGYVQRGYSYHGHDYARRSYYYQGHEYNRYYRGYGYRGMSLNIYSPGVYYGPGFYGWAYNPWAAPIAFGWGWGGNPWYGYYGGYFQPYPVYPSASFWLTDYIISQDLQAAYAAHQEAGEVDGAPSAAGGPPALTPDVKQQIADEVKGQLALENAEATQTAQHQDVDPASSGIARILADVSAGRAHVFVAGGALDVTNPNGQECALSDGDVLLLQAPPPADATTADLVVLASKGGQECPKSSAVTVQMTDLQEMQNHMRETIDQGLQDLQAKQGKGGLPPAPPSAQTPPTATEFAAIAPPPTPQDAADLQQQSQQADQAEQDVQAEAAQDSGAAAQDNGGAASAAPAAPASVEMGQTLDQVQAAMGTPTRVANLGSKVIYYYNGMKVVFQDGKVADVQ